jgi:WD40 repeat protein
MDFFFGWASVNGFKAKLNESGSWFSTALCEVIKDNFHCMDLLEMDAKVRDKLKEEKKIVTSQSTSTLRKKCFFGPRNGNKNIRSTFKKILTVNTCWSVSNKGEYSFVFDYFKPLIEYSDGDPYTNTVLNQPLWFNRQKKLKLEEEEKSIEEELSKIIDENNDISFLAKCILLSLNKTTSYSQLSDDDQNKLKILSSSFDPYATSLLITFLIREDINLIRGDINLIRDIINLRNIAVELLKKGESSLDSVELKIFEGEKFELIKNTFIDLTNARLTALDLNGIDFSGQNLNYSTFQESSIENVKFNYCSLKSSNFNLSRLRFCYFNHSHLVECNLKVTAISCHFNDCFLVNANLSSSTFEKCVFNASNFEKAILTKCSFDDSSFENVLDLNKEQLLNQSISFRNECLIDDSLFLSNKQYFEDIRKKKGIKLKIQGLNRQLEGHSDSVRCLVKLKNGHLASGSWDKKIKLWDTNTGQCIQTLEGHSNNVYSLIELENGHLASSSDDKTIKLWNIENGECFNTFKGHSKTVYCLVELKNGLLASGSLDKTIKLWNTTTGECIKTLEKHLNSINCLIEFKNGYLASGSEDTTIKLWNIETGRCKTLNGHSSTVYCLVELKNGDLASGSWDKKIFLWNTTTFQLIKTLGRHSYSVNCLIELNNGHLASGSSDNTIKLWNTKTNECIHTLDGHSGSIICLIEFKNGHLASGSSDTTIKLWEYASLLGPI